MKNSIILNKNISGQGTGGKLRTFFKNISPLNNRSDMPQFVLSGIINLAAISCLFSFLTLRTGNIWAATGLHSMWNFGLACVLGLGLSGSEGNVSVINMRAEGENLLNGGIYGIEASIITTSLLIAAALLVWHSYKKDNSERKA